MNMITVLLGTTGLLLIVALGLSFSQMNDDVKQEDINALKQEIAALEVSHQQDLLRQQQALYNPRPLTPSTPAVNPTLTPPPTNPTLNPLPREGAPVVDTTKPPAPDPDTAALIAEMEQKEKERKAEIERLKAEKEQAEKEAKTAKNELGVAWQPQIEAHEKNQRLAKTIKSAILQARILEWSEKDGFAAIKILHPDLVPEGTTLAIRRRSGIYGQLKVSSIYENGQAIADPIPNTFLGKDGIDIQPGDELIIPPRFN